MTNEQRIKSLKDAGCEVKISHWRPTNVPGLRPILMTRHALDALNDERVFVGSHEVGTVGETGIDVVDRRPWVFLPTGGETEVTIIPQVGVPVSGRAVCRPDESFNRKLGLTIALGRAVKELR